MFCYFRLLYLYKSVARSGYVYKISDPDGSESEDTETNILKNILSIVIHIQNIQL